MVVEPDPSRIGANPNPPTATSSSFDHFVWCLLPLIFRNRPLTMRLFTCPSCPQLVYFENSQCLRCASEIGLDPHHGHMRAVGEWRRCQGGAPACNWLVAPNDGEKRCVSCRLTKFYPTGQGAAIQQWNVIETAKRRLLYSLLALRLPIHGMQFVFTEDTMTGHADGVISVNLAEADDVERERRRVDLHEPYRTLVGHLRHESGHYFWDLLVRNSPRLTSVRALFADDQLEYSAALQQYYKQGAPADWAQRYISAYATSHAWEDWAETWAHYLHLCDAVEIAAAYRLSLGSTKASRPTPTGAPAEPASAQVDLAAGIPDDFAELLAAWIPLTHFANSLNRSIGLRDWYPFVLSDTIIDKLRLIHDIIRERPPEMASPTQLSGASPA